jgi:hypothetical protein
MRMNVAGNQWQVFVFREDRLVLGYKCQGFVIVAEIVQIIGEVIDAFPVIG